MRNKSIKSKVMAGLLMAGIIMSVGSGVSAAGNGMTNQLDALVTSGTITSVQETAIINAITPAAPTNDGTQKADRQTEMKTKLDALVTAGTITSAQETAIITALTPTAPTNNGT
ncbi:hypothetical protein JMF89_14690, partial [Clostridiaceae bacterium UIB06]|nr:hypothetical protein [Clostridiaceae bacterium UIB06]